MLKHKCRIMYIMRQFTVLFAPPEVTRQVAVCGFARVFSSSEPVMFAGTVKVAFGASALYPLTGKIPCRQRRVRCFQDKSPTSRHSQPRGRDASGQRAPASLCRSMRRSDHSGCETGVAYPAMPRRSRAAHREARQEPLRPIRQRRSNRQIFD